MTMKGPGRRELTEFMPNHVLADENRNELLPVVHGKGYSDKFGQDGGPARPSLYYLAVADVFGFGDFIEQVSIYKWPFF